MITLYRKEYDGTTITLSNIFVIMTPGKEKEVEFLVNFLYLERGYYT